MRVPNGLSNSVLKCFKTQGEVIENGSDTRDPSEVFMRNCPHIEDTEIKVWKDADETVVP